VPQVPRFWAPGKPQTSTGLFLITKIFRQLAAPPHRAPLRLDLEIAANPGCCAIPGAQKRGTWATQLQWLCSLLPHLRHPLVLMALVSYPGPIFARDVPGFALHVRAGNVALIFAVFIVYLDVD